MRLFKERELRVPKAMRVAPELPAVVSGKSPEPRLVLFINPFYPKDPHASFGKHVLTPTLALTSIAAATPADWAVKYWDENLLQGPPPGDPLPSVVAITVHQSTYETARRLARFRYSRTTASATAAIATAVPGPAIHHPPRAVCVASAGNRYAAYCDSPMHPLATESGAENVS